MASKSGQPQDPEVRKANLAKAPGGLTATGKAISESEDAERVKSLDNEGGDEDLIVGTPKADHAEAETSKPEGLQKEPSAFATNGSVSGRMVSSPNGAVPVSAVTSDPEEAERLLQEKRDNEVETLERRRNPQNLSEAQISQMSRDEVRSVLESKHGQNAGDTANVGAGQLRRRLIDLESEREEPKSGSSEDATTGSGSKASSEKSDKK